MESPTSSRFGSRAARQRLLSLFALASLCSAFAFATTVVPVSDQQLFERADVIVHGIVTKSNVNNSPNFVQTVTVIAPLEILKGTLHGQNGGNLVVHQVGGQNSYGLISRMWGSPQYPVGEEVIVYAIKRGEGDFQTAELFLGKLDVQKDSNGVAFAVPALAAEMNNPEVVVVNPRMRSEPGDGSEDQPDPAAPRELEGYLRFLRSGATLPLPVQHPTGSLEPVVHRGDREVHVSPLWANFNGLYRWNNGATASFTLDGQANITGGGSAEAAGAVASWDNEPNSVINYSIGTSGSNPMHLNALSSPCGWNICFSGTGVIGCSSISAMGTHTWEGESYTTLLSGEVWERSYCSFNYYDSAINQAILTHELGHTLGLGHSDQAAAPRDVCRGDEDQAQMRSSVQVYTQLGTDDSDAVRWLYGDGGNSCTKGHTLTVTKTGNGSGTVSSAPAWISCGPACSGFFAAGTVVTLTAAPDPNSVFAGWSGDSDCSDGSVTMTSDKACTARFDAWSDLVVSALTVPTTGAAGLAISVTDTTLNQPGALSAPASVTRFYLSNDLTFDAYDRPLASRSVPALAAGGSSSATTVLTIPLGTAPGTYTIIAKADADGLITEINEANNTRSGSITISGPDLIVSALSLPNSAVPGASFTVSHTVKNQGAGSAGASTTSFYFSADGALGAGDVLLGRAAIGPLAASATSSASTTLTMPSSAVPGSYYILAVADDGGAVAETLETNNMRSGAIAVSGPDLVVSALTIPTSIGAGSSFPVSHTVKNQGSGAATASTTAFYLSTDAASFAGGVLLGKAAVGSLAANATLTISTTLATPASVLPGSYYVIAIANDGGAVAEILKTNNGKSGATAVPGPDLIVLALTVPSYGGAGLPITLSHTTMNLGALPAAASTTGFYLSTNSTLGNDDVLLGSAPIGPLAAGGTLALSTTFTIPPSTAPGSYYIIAKADDGAAVAETVETNNTSARQIKISPDLVVSALTIPITASAGATISASDTTKNQGSGTANATTTSFYLSTNTTHSAKDVLLRSRSVPMLASGAMSTATISLTIPSGAPAGTYYVIAVADDGGAVAEANENNNNKASRAITVSH